MLIRAFQEEDLGFVKERNFILALQIQHCGDYDRMRTFTAINDKEEIVGVGTISYHGSWKDECKEHKHKLVFDYCIVEGDEAIFEVLLDEAKKRVQQLEEIAYKKVCLMSFVEASDIKETQNFLKQDFYIGQCIPILKYELKDERKHYTLPEDIHIEELDKTNIEEVRKYIAATAKANEGVPDSIHEFMFRANDKNFRTYYATNGKEIIGGISIWHIGKERGATENIFTIPEYRRKNVASELIVTAFDKLQEAGKKIATLTLMGDNSQAMQLYQKIGYKLIGHIFEVHWDVH